MTNQPSIDWITRFPALARLNEASRRQLAESARCVHIATGTQLFSPGQSPSNYLLALSGSIRVQKVSERGREIVLYRVSAGESCVLTTACLIGHDPYEAEAVTETACEAVLIPRAVFDNLVGQDGEFRRFVFSSFSARMSDLLRLIDDVAFARIDVRLAHKLLELAGTSTGVSITHQQLAAELGTAREVISRQLHEFQRHGWVGISRGTLSLLDRPALERYARS